jgi:hypothetical protein
MMDVSDFSGQRASHHLLFADTDVAMLRPVAVELPASVEDLRQALTIFNDAISKSDAQLGGKAEKPYNFVKFSPSGAPMLFVFSQDGALLPTVEMIRFEAKLVLNTSLHFTLRQHHHCLEVGEPLQQRSRLQVQEEQFSETETTGSSADAIRENTKLKNSPGEEKCAMIAAQDQRLECEGDTVNRLTKEIDDFSCLPVGSFSAFEETVAQLRRRRRPFERRTPMQIEALLEDCRRLRLATLHHLSKESASPRGARNTHQQPGRRPRLLAPPPPEDLRDARSLSGGTTLLASVTLSRWSPSPSPDAPGSQLTTIGSSGETMPMRRLEQRYFPEGASARNPLLPPPPTASTADRGLITTNKPDHTAGTVRTASLSAQQPSSRGSSPVAVIPAAPAGHAGLPSDLFRIPLNRIHVQHTAAAAPTVTENTARVPEVVPIHDPSCIEQLVKDHLPLSCDPVWFADEITEKATALSGDLSCSSSAPNCRVLVHGPSRSGKTTSINIIATRKGGICSDGTSGIFDSSTFVVVYNWTKLLMSEPAARRDLTIFHCELVALLVECIIAHRSRSLGRYRSALLMMFKKVVTHRAFQSVCTSAAPGLVAALGGVEVLRAWDLVLRPMHSDMQAVLLARGSRSALPVQTVLHYFQLALVDFPAALAASLRCERLMYVFDDADALLTINPASTDDDLAAEEKGAHDCAVLDVSVDGGRTIGMEVFRLWLSHILLSPSTKILFVGSLGSANLNFSPTSPKEQDHEKGPPAQVHCFVGGVALSIPLRTTQIVGLVQMLPIGVLVEKYKLPSRIRCTGNGTQSFFDIGVFAGCPGFLSYLCNFVQELRNSSWNPQLFPAAGAGGSDTPQKTLNIEDQRVFALFEEMAATLAVATRSQLTD